MNNNIFTFHDISFAEQNEYRQMGCITPLKDISAPEENWTHGHTIDWYISRYKKYCTASQDEIDEALLQGEEAYRKEIRAMHEKFVHKNGRLTYKEELERRYYSSPSHDAMKLEAWTKMIDSIFREVRTEYFHHAAQALIYPFMSADECRLMTRTIVDAMLWGDDSNTDWNTVRRYDWLKENLK